MTDDSPLTSHTRPKVTVDKTSIEQLEGRITNLEIRVAGMDEKVKNMASVTETIRSNMFGSDKEVGLMERLRTIERFMGDIKKVGWAAVIVLIGLVVSQLYYIFALHPVP